MSRQGQVSALALLMAGALASPAFAQPQPTPPEHYTLDANGVDLVSGEFTYATTDVVIGDRPTAASCTAGS